MYQSARPVVTLPRVCRQPLYCWFLSLACTAGLAGCGTLSAQPGRESPPMRQHAAQEIDRICALPEEARQAEIQRIKAQSGLQLYCAHP